MMMMMMTERRRNTHVDKYGCRCAECSVSDMRSETASGCPTHLEMQHTDESIDHCVPRTRSNLQHTTCKHFYLQILNGYWLSGKR